MGVVPERPIRTRTWLEAWKDAPYIARQAAQEAPGAAQTAQEPVDEPDDGNEPYARRMVPPSNRERMVAAALGIELPPDPGGEAVPAELDDPSPV